MPRAFLQTAFQDLRPQFYPDGRRVAYSSNETGRVEVYVTPFPGPGAKIRVSTGGGSYPPWRRDGRELFFPRTTGAVTTVVAASMPLQGNVLQPGDVRPVFDVRLGEAASLWVPGFHVRCVTRRPARPRQYRCDETTASAISLVIKRPAALPE